MTDVARRLWVTAGWLIVGYVVLTFAGAAFAPDSTIGDTKSHVTSALVTSSMTKVFASGYVEFIAGMVFLVACLLIAHLLRGGGDLDGWLSSTITASAIVFTAVEVAAGAAGAAAVYNGHHGAPLAIVTTVDDIRNVAFSLSGGVAGLLTLAIAAAGRSTSLLPRWLSYTGYVVGVLLIAAVPAAKAGAPQVLLWFAWLVAFAVAALRVPRRGMVSAPATLAVNT